MRSPSLDHRKKQYGFASGGPFQGRDFRAFWNILHMRWTGRRKWHPHFIERYNACAPRPCEAFAMEILANVIQKCNQLDSR
jgi:hypothetical protein